MPPNQPQPVAAAPTPAPEQSKTDTYHVPPKRRTTPRIAALRKQLRGKLVASIDEFDGMDSRKSGTPADCPRQVEGRAGTRPHPAYTA